MRILILLLAALVAAPAAVADSPHWLQLRSEHFVIITDSNEKEARHLAGQFEQMRAVFHKLLPKSDADKDAAPIIVLGLKDAKSFRTLEPESYLAKGQLKLAGYFLNGGDKNYILLDLDELGEEHPFSTVYHEYTHYMMRKLPWIPIWMNEGLAEFYQNTDIEAKDVIFGEPDPYEIYYLRDHQLLPLPTLLAVDHSSPYYHDEQKGSVFYAESWALMHMIQFSDFDHHTHYFLDYAVNLARGQDPVTAAQNAFGDLTKFQATLQSYVQHGDYRQFRLPSAITFDESTFKVEPITFDQADAVRAGVLLGIDRTKEAESLLNDILHDDPKNELACETMGYLKLREGDHAAAKKWYTDAVQLDSQSYLAHYYFAVLSLDADERSPATESSLRAAIKLNPDFAPSYDALARFYLLNNEKLDEAHTLNVQAVQLEPENLNYRINTASVLERQQNLESALSVLQLAKKIAKTPNEIEIVDSRIHLIEQFQASRERFKNIETSTSATSATTTTTTTMSNVPVDNPGTDFVDDGPHYPAGPPTGPHHTVSGILHGVHCSYPTVLTLNLDQTGKPLLLYTNNYYKVPFSTSGYIATGDVDPCKSIDGMKAKIEYGEVSDKTMAGQIISIELSK